MLTVNNTPALKNFRKAIKDYALAAIPSSRVSLIERLWKILGDPTEPIDQSDIAQLLILWEIFQEVNVDSKTAPALSQEIFAYVSSIVQ